MSEPAAEQSPAPVQTIPAIAERAEDIDLNRLFPGETDDLNRLFPDLDMKQFLKKLSRNKKDLARMRENLGNTFQQEPAEPEAPPEPAPE